MRNVKVLNVEITSFTPPDFKKGVKNLLTSKKSSKIGKINTEFLLRSLKMPEFCDVLGGCDYNIADGKGVLWAAKYLSLPLRARKFPNLVAEAIWQMVYSGASLVFNPKYCNSPICNNIPGVESLYLILEAASESGAGVYFLGAEKEVNERAVEILKKKYPQLKIVGNMGGFWKDGEEIEDIQKSRANLLIVALGSPKQEYWINDNLSKLSDVRLAVGEGGSLDFIAGDFRRAPKWMQKGGLEWLWRLFINKSKSATGKRTKRVWNAVPVFIYNVVKWKIGSQEIRD